LLRHASSSGQYRLDRFDIRYNAAPVHPDAARFGTDVEAQAAGSASMADVESGMIAVMIEMLGEFQDTRCAGFHAQPASFAFLSIGYYGSFIRFYV
jgi:hypothetical protein